MGAGCRVSQSVSRASRAFFLRARYAFNMNWGGGMSNLGGRGASRINGSQGRFSVKGITRCAMASMGRCFLIEGVGVGVRQSRGRYMDESPFVM